MRSIIVEGMDGSGKDTLIKDLLEVFPTHTLHSRASTSLGGPVKDLGEWVARDSVRLSETGPWIYNRHPLVSEPIYGKYRPNKPTEPIFLNGGWRNAYQRIVAAYSVLVICQPPFRVVSKVLEAQGSEAHMAGVYEHQEELYTDYAALTWPGRTIRYDYTKDTLGSLFNLLQTSVSDK